VSSQPPPGWRSPLDSQPPAPRRNFTLFALAAIAVLVVAGGVRAVPPGLAVLLIAALVVVMTFLGKRDDRARREAELRQWYVQRPNAERWEPPPSLADSRKTGWSVAGTVLAAIAAIGGLAILGMVVVLFVALSSGNFKLGNK